MQSRFLNYSIVIPVLNEELLLENLLKQLSNKELKDHFKYEIIVSDGGSTDNSMMIANKYADKIILNDKEQKQNIAIGRNKGAKFADGEVLMFVNGDVLLQNDLKNFFEVIHKTFFVRKYDALACKVKIFKEEENFCDVIFHFIYNNYFRLLNFLGIGMARGECQVIKKDVFNNLNGYNPTLAAGEDFDLFRRLKNSGYKIYYTFKISVFESPRRFRKLGYFNVTCSWTKNGFSVLLKNRSLSKEWQQVR